MINTAVTIPRHRRASHFSASGLFAGLKEFCELERRIEALATPQERGDAFEVFAEAYLNIQKITQAAEVWPESAIPSDVVSQLKLPPKDMGVDGVYRTLSDDYAAYQVKFRTGRKPQTWSELSKFVGLADRAKLKVLFTNSTEVLDVVTDRRDIFCIRGPDMDRLTEADLTAIDAWLRGKLSPLEVLRPRPHQAEALDAIVGGLAGHDRVTTVMACGTGKTLTALWLAERLGSQRVLVLLPSLSLVRQTLHEWLKHTSWVRPRFMAVCSDPTVTNGIGDAMVVHQADLDFPVTTEPSDVKEFLQEEGPGGVQVVFSTYQSAHVVGEAITGQQPFELGIFDEAHKTAGREGSRFAFALEDKNIPVAKRAFMTATPRHYDVRSKDKEGDKKLVYSMDVPEVYGPIVHTLSFAQAARSRIICDFKIIISVVTSEMINDELLKHGEVLIDGEAIKARSVASQIALKQACEEHDLRKVFSFHSSVASARDFTGITASGIRTHMPSYQALHVNGAMRTAVRETIMTDFREAERAIISNARCLTEGVDVPAVDVVAFLSPRKSKVDIVQAAGRAMRKSDQTGKEFGYLLLPLFLETEAGESVEDALERTGFSEAWDVLQAMQEQDAELADIVREMRIARGKTGGFDDTRLREKIEVLGPEISLEAIRKSITTSIADQLGISWDERFGELVRYKEQYGDCRVPQTWSQNRELARWVSKQRGLATSGSLSAERKGRLEALGFDWDPYATQWEESFLKLLDFKRQHQHCRVPRTWRDRALSTWVSAQRSARKAGRLERDKLSRLEDVGFEWAPFDSRWEKKLKNLIAFKTQYGDCDVTAGRTDDVSLVVWVTMQRRNCRKGNLSPEQVQALEALGFIWAPDDHSWQEKYQKLEEFRSANGHCNVPIHSPKITGLGPWVNSQRSAFAKGKLSKNKIELLEKLGFVWDVRDEYWQEQYDELVAFRSNCGHCNVPIHAPATKDLGNWVNRQRSSFAKGELPKEKIRKLEDIAFVWNTRDAAWDEFFDQLMTYKAETGHCNVPRGSADHPQLANWVANQRAKWRRGALPEDRQKRLEEIGFEWEPKR